jgi:adenosylcobinamide-GDP ribazoletransferase
MPAASAAASQLRALAASVAFLTRIPIGRRLALDGADVARGALLFPVVGAGIGAAVGGTALLFHELVPALPAAGLALALGVFLTGAIHLDGLADTADALGGRSRAEALAIMRDHAVGSYGVAALIVDLLVKAALVAALLDQGDTVIALVAASALARAAPLPLAYLLPYARKDSGPGGVLGGRISLWSVVGAVAVAAALALVLLGVRGAWMIAAAALLALFLGVVFRRWLGGVTGDGLGATTELCDTLALLVAVAAL